MTPDLLRDTRGHLWRFDGRARIDDTHCKFEHLTIAEAAQALNISPAEVNKKLDALKSGETLHYDKPQAT